MSFDDWVHLMKQKYSVVVAIAVTQNKPSNLTNEEYIKELRSQLEPINVMDFDTISLCSDDFDVNDEMNTQYDEPYTGSQLSIQEARFSPTILGNFDFETNILQENHLSKSDSLSDTLTLLKAVDRDMFGVEQTKEFSQYSLHQNIQENQSTYFENSLRLDHDCAYRIHGNHEALRNNLTDTQTSFFGPQKETKDTAKDNMPQKTQQMEIDSQNTILYTLPGCDSNTYVSQTQGIDNQFEIQQKYIIGIRKHKNNNIDLEKYSRTSENKQDGTDISSNKINGIYNEDETQMNDECNEEHQIKCVKTKSVQNDDTAPNTLEQIDEFGPNNLKSNNFLKLDEMHQEFESQTENAIPFKIIEELNKIKTSLRRNERRHSTDSFSTDSGFLSDSQIKSSYRSGMHSQGNLNQSGHSLFLYLMNCPLTCNTIEITNEISEVLGDLVDKLHGDEIYPAFLDEVLEFIKMQVERICEDGNGRDATSQNKDESIHRLLLINRSLHIITFTIDKIAAILEVFHTNLTTDQNLYETTNIVRSENICYIFHVLELLIQRYGKKKTYLASLPCSQVSEDDKMPKKSSITEIWRKKWDPDYKKREKVETNAEKTNLGIKIGDVLNRLVVDCMDGYSLISFAALQCFNLLQS